MSGCEISLARGKLHPCGRKHYHIAVRIRYYHSVKYRLIKLAIDIYPRCHDGCISYFFFFFRLFHIQTSWNCRRSVTLKDQGNNLCCGQPQWIFAVVLRCEHCELILCCVLFVEKDYDIWPTVSQMGQRSWLKISGLEYIGKWCKIVCIKRKHIIIKCHIMVYQKKG